MKTTTTQNGLREDLKKIYEVKTVCGSENSALDFVKSELSDFCDEIFADDIGNVYAVKKGVGENRKKIAVVCPFDEAGFVVTSVKDEKNARLQAIGKPDLSRLCGKEAKIVGKDISGILLCDKDTPEAGDFYLQTGASPEDDGIAEGDFVSISDTPSFLSGDLSALGAVCTKAHGASLLAVAKCAGDFSFDVIFVFAAAHLSGARGEKCAAFVADADECICLDMCTEGTASVGKGPCIAFSDAGGNCSREIIGKLENAAKNIGIGYQLKADNEKDRPSVIAPFIANGTKTALVSVCASKLSKGIGICNLCDLRGAAALVCAYLIFEETEKEEEK